MNVSASNALLAFLFLAFSGVQDLTTHSKAIHATESFIRFLPTFHTFLAALAGLLFTSFTHSFTASTHFFIHSTAFFHTFLIHSLIFLIQYHHKLVIGVVAASIHALDRLSLPHMIQLFHSNVLVVSVHKLYNSHHSFISLPTFHQNSLSNVLCISSFNNEATFALTFFKAVHGTFCFL
jgi:hypothetical protein